VHLNVLAGLARQHAKELRKAQDARKWALDFIDQVDKWQFRCFLKELPKPMLLLVCEAIAYALTELLRFSHSEPGYLIGPVPPATGVPACSSNIGVIWWGQQAYVKPRLKSGSGVSYK